MVQFVGNVHGDETLGRQLIIYLAEYLGKYRKRVKKPDIVVTIGR